MRTPEYEAALNDIKRQALIIAKSSTLSVRQKIELFRDIFSWSRTIADRMDTADKIDRELNFHNK